MATHEAPQRTQRGGDLIRRFQFHRRPDPMRHRRRMRGVSILEVMVSLGILVYGVLGVTAGQIASMNYSTISRSNTLAMYLAQEQMEIFQLMSGDEVLALLDDPGYPNDPSNPIDPDPGDGTAMAFTRRWTIEEDTPEDGVITITVAVNWTNALGNQRTASIQSLKADM